MNKTPSRLNALKAIKRGEIFYDPQGGDFYLGGEPDSPQVSGSRRRTMAALLRHMLAKPSSPERRCKLVLTAEGKSTLDAWEPRPAAR